MTGPMIVYTIEELDRFREQLKAGETLPAETCQRLCTNVAWLLGMTKGHAELLELHAVSVEENAKARNSAILMFEANKKLEKTIARLKREADEDDALRERLSSLLTRTANALKGEPGPLALHDWSDLPDVAARAINALTAAGVDFQPITSSMQKRIAAQRAPREE